MLSKASPSLGSRQPFPAMLWVGFGTPTTQQLYVTAVYKVVHEILLNPMHASHVTYEMELTERFDLNQRRGCENDTAYKCVCFAEEFKNFSTQNADVI